jgi:tetratricopeptide (TPR) repeat protein
MEVESLLEKDAGEIFRALYRHEYDIIHIAAHGEFNEPLVDDAIKSKKQRPSGVVLGKGRYLTSGEFENLRAVPSVVFLNCCHLARMEQDGRDKAVPLRNPSRLAASVAEELIKMGVGVVVAAGWAVGDAAAKVFAEFFYRQLLRGETVMSAVRVARKRAYGQGGASDLTWGAYQVYGDPGTVLHWADSRREESTPVSRRFVSSHEVVDYVSDFSARSRGIVDDQNREGFRSELAQIETGLPEEWGGEGEVLTAFGEAYKSLGNYREAIERYRRAIAHSDAPLKTVEQLANLESVQAESLAPSDPDASYKLFQDSLARLDSLLELSPSSERYSLRGATLKRRAKVTSNRNKRVSYIREARRAYAEACKLDPPDLYYPLSNKVALDMCLDPKRVKTSDLEAIVRNAEARDDKWSYATIADARLIRFLAFGKGTAEDTAAGYIRAMNRADIRDSDSMRHQVESLVELALGERVKKRAAQVLAHLPDKRKV